MKSFARLQWLVVLSVCSLVYLVWQLRAFDPVLARARLALQKHDEASTRFVVFGDAWSSTESNSVSLQAPGVPSNRIRDQGRLWIEVLCEELGCTHIDNYARASRNGVSDPTGPVVSNSVYGQTTGTENLTAFNSPNHLLPDLEIQVRDFLASGRQKTQSGSWTVFTVYFGTWDIWHYATLDKVEGMDAVEKTIATMFKQLDSLMDNIPDTTRITVVIPRLFDSTWLPKWITERTSTEGSDKYGLIQRQAVTLKDYWDRLLDQRASEFQRHTVTPDFNEWFLLQIRQFREMQYGYKDMLSPGSHLEVDDWKIPCVNNSAGGLARTTCENATRHLFWDDSRLGGAAHELLGKYVSELLVSSQNP